LVAIRSQHHERRYYNSFFIVETLLTVFTNVLHQNEGLHNDGDQKKRKKVPMIVKMGRRTPAPPRGGTSL
jgi:hypothetical protein